MSTGQRPAFRSVSVLEFAAGWVPGLEQRVTLDTEHPDDDPTTALERLLLPALVRDPCVVGYSGGRDSALVLAVALRLARREGLPEPVAVTKRYPGHDETDETDWQEYIARHLGVAEWEIQRFDDELDLLGPAAQESLRRHGPQWPATLHNRAPQLAVARGGVYLGGEGGDEVMGPFRAGPLVSHLRRPNLRGGRLAKDLVKILGPAVVRRRIAERGLTDDELRPWLLPEAHAWYRRSLVEDQVRRPIGYAAALSTHLSHRAIRTALHNLRTIGHHLDVDVQQPLLAPSFAAALVRDGHRLGTTSRTATMRAHFSDLLPDAILARTSKATFNSVYAGRHARAAIEAWDGRRGIDTDVVDAEALRTVWSEPVIHGGTFQLLQAAWLAADRAKERSVPTPPPSSTSTSPYGRPPR